ncbi:MAG: dipeptide epimerase [Caulobacteraceae bacterium]|nr:dipeptide epimerase [Caulobacteraceae bacterium]
MKLEVRKETWPYSTPFRITNYVFTCAEVVLVTIEYDGMRGRGEASGVYYHGETPDSLLAQIEEVRGCVEAGVERADLARLLPAGGARNALDAALWDLEAKRAGVPVWMIADAPRPRPLTTTFTVSAGSAFEMAEAARAYEGLPALKLKLTGDDPVGCIQAVRQARPDAWLGVDANQGLSRRDLERMLPALVEARVRLIEQPLPVGEDIQLEGLASPILIAADESVQSRADLPSLVGRYQVANIKLDKSGGLTEGLAMAQEARRLGLRVMVGCMSGTSLAMAPAFVLGQLCDFVDLDGPTFLLSDREPAATYADGQIWCPDELWGAPAPPSRSEVQG